MVKAVGIVRGRVGKVAIFLPVALLIEPLDACLEFFLPLIPFAFLPLL